MQSVDDTITIEVKNRLDDLFGETADESLEYMNAKMQDLSPLKDLKAALLSLDWEITEDVMSDFVHQVDLLKKRFKQDRLISLFLQLLGSVGKYVQAYKGRSHPQAFKLLNTAFNRLEEVMTFPDLKEADKKRYLYAEIIKFKELREKIGLERPPAPMEERVIAAKHPGAAAPAPVQMSAATAAGEAKSARAGLSADPGEARVPTQAADGNAPPVFFEVSEEMGRRKDRSRKPGPAAERAAAERQTAAAFAAVFSKPQTEAEPAGPPPVVIQDPASVLAALEEIKTMLREEFAQLRAQIRSSSRSR